MSFRLALAPVAVPGTTPYRRPTGPMPDWVPTLLLARSEGGLGDESRGGVRASVDYSGFNLVSPGSGFVRKKGTSCPYRVHRINMTSFPSLDSLL